MPKVPEFYSINEAKKPETKRVYHNNSACAPGRDIPEHERRLGKGPSGETYRPCEDCKKETELGH